MNGLSGALGEVGALIRSLKAQPPAARVVICPPATLISRAAAEASGAVELGGQDCHPKTSGAYTGDVSAEMLRDAGAAWVIVGHSERRQYQKESNAVISKKAAAVHAASLKPIVCVGETLEEREGGQMEKVLETQVRGSLAGLTKEQMVETIIAYEPVWAIGTGKTATTQQAQDVHAFIRALLAKIFDEAVAKKVRIQYGGSVKPANAKELMGQPDVDGALVGGASLEARSFADIIKNSI